MQRKKMYLNWLTAIAVAIVCVCFISCGDDDDNVSSNNSDLVGYWVKEAHLNNPVRNGSGGIVISYGYQFLDNGTVYVFQLQHTGLGSKYSYAEAKTYWEKIAERNGVSFYRNPDKKTKNYTRTGNEVFIAITSDPVIMRITGTDRINAESADGWTEGTYVRIKK